MFDVILSSCECVVVCLECNKEAPVHGLSYGQPVTSWCGNCHTKLCMAIEEVKFYSHQLSDCECVCVSSKHHLSHIQPLLLPVGVLSVVLRKRRKSPSCIRKANHFLILVPVIIIRRVIVGYGKCMCVCVCV